MLKQIFRALTFRGHYAYLPTVIFFWLLVISSLGWLSAFLNLIGWLQNKGDNYAGFTLLFWPLHSVTERSAAWLFVPYSDPAYHPNMAVDLGMIKTKNCYDWDISCFTHEPTVMGQIVSVLFTVFLVFLLNFLLSVLIKPIVSWIRFRLSTNHNITN